MEGAVRGGKGGAEVSFKKWVLACHRLHLLSLSRFFFRLKKTFFSSLLSSTLWLHGFEWTFERDEKFNKWKRTSLTHTHTHSHTHTHTHTHTFPPYVRVCVRVQKVISSSLLNKNVNPNYLSVLKAFSSWTENILTLSTLFETCWYFCRRKRKKTASFN